MQIYVKLLRTAILDAIWHANYAADRQRQSGNAEMTATYERIAQDLLNTRQDVDRIINAADVQAEQVLADEPVPSGSQATTATLERQWATEADATN